MAVEYDDQIPMNTQEDKKEITTHPTGRFGSWEIIDENNATILCDKFFFEYKGLEIPENVRWFFDVDESGFYENVDLLLVIDGLEYSANIRKRGHGTGITRMFWGDSLKMEFDSIDRSEPQHVIEFHRAGNNRFELNISGYVRKNRAWLLTWNKDKWNWENYEECCEQTKQGQPYKDTWSCVSKSPQVGEEIFLIKLGEKPRGIIGHGYVCSESYEAPHYDPDKAAAGKKSNHIDVSFDRLINYKVNKIVTQEELKENCSEQHWSPMGSGVEIKKYVLPKLRSLWNEAVNEDSEWWPSLSEYNPNISADEYRELFLNEKIVKHTWLEALYELYQMPDHLGTCKQLGIRYGHAPTHYISYFSSAAVNIVKETGCSVPDKDENTKYWPVLFQGKYVSDKSQGNYCWRMRKRVQQAIEMLVEMGIFRKRKRT